MKERMKERKIERKTERKSERERARGRDGDTERRRDGESRIMSGPFVSCFDV